MWCAPGAAGCLKHFIDRHNNVLVAAQRLRRAIACITYWIVHCNAPTTASPKISIIFVYIGKNSLNKHFFHLAHAAQFSHNSILPD